MRKYFNNSLWLLLEKSGRLVVGLMVGILVARYLGPEYYGHLSYILVVYSILKIISSLGLEQVVVKDFSVGEVPENIIRTNYFFVKTLLGVLVFALFTLYVVSSANSILIFAIPVVATLVLQGMDVFELQCQSVGDSKLLIKRTLSVVVLTSVVKIGLIQAEAPAHVFILFLFFEFALVLVCYYSVKKKSERLFYPACLDGGYIKSRLSLSWPLFLSSGSVLIYMKVDMVMLYGIHGAAESGIYAVSTRISEILYFVPSVLLIGMFPALIQIRETSFDKYREFATDLCAMLSVTSIGCILFFYVFGDFLITFLFGREYSASVPILMVHVIACFAVFPGVVFRKMVIADGNQRVTLYAILVGLVINVILNVILIPAYSGVGAAYATLFSRIFGSLLVYFYFKQTRYFLGIFLKSLFPPRWFLVINNFKRLVDEADKKQN